MCKSVLVIIATFMAGCLAWMAIGLLRVAMWLSRAGEWLLTVSR
jgi:hypothetical protein